MRQFDVQANGLGADIERAAVGGLHQTGPAAGRDHEARRRRGADQAPEFARYVIVAAFAEDALGGRQAKQQAEIFRIGAGFTAQRLDVAPRCGRLGNPRAAVNNDGMVDVLLRQDHIGLEVFDLQSRAANIGPSDEINVLLGEPIARALANRSDRLRRAGIFLGRLRAMPRQRFSPMMRMRRRRHSLGRIRGQAKSPFTGRSRFFRSPARRLSGSAAWRDEEQAADDPDKEKLRPDHVDAGAAVQNRLRERHEVRRRRGLHRRRQPRRHAVERRVAAGQHVHRQEHQHEEQAELRHGARDRAEKDPDRRSRRTDRRARRP